MSDFKSRPTLVLGYSNLADKPDEQLEYLTRAYSPCDSGSPGEFFINDLVLRLQVVCAGGSSWYESVIWDENYPLNVKYIPTPKEIPLIQASSYGAYFCFYPTNHLHLKTTKQKGAWNAKNQNQQIDGEPELLFESVCVQEYTIIRSEQDEGLFFPLVSRGDHVQQGELVGQLTDYFGNTIQKIVAPYDGVILYIIATPPMSRGETMVSVGKF